jgi:hypothetical protein
MNKITVEMSADKYFDIENLGIDVETILKENIKEISLDGKYYYDNFEDMTILKKYHQENLLDPLFRKEV